MLVNDEPVTAWEIEQRAGFVAANSGGNPKDMKAKAEARWAQIVKDPKTNERFQDFMRANNVQSQEQAKALQADFVKKLQADMIDQIRRESRAGMVSQFRKQAQEELIEERLKLQEAKKLGVEISDDDAKRMLQGIADRNKMTIDQFAQQVKSTGFDISTLRERLRSEQAWREVVRRRFGAQININQKDVDRVLSAAATEAGEDAVELQVQKVTLPIPGRADQATLVRRFSEAQALQGKADGCKNMASLAKAAPDAKFEDSKYVKPGNLPEPTRSLMLLAKDGDVLPPARAVQRHRDLCRMRAPSSQGRREAARERHAGAAAEGIQRRRQAVPARPEAGSPYRVSLRRHDRAIPRLRLARGRPPCPAARPDHRRSCRNRPGHHAGRLAAAGRARSAPVRRVRRPRCACARAPASCIWTCRWRWSARRVKRRPPSPTRCRCWPRPPSRLARDTAVVDTIVQATAAVAAGDCLALVTNPIAKQSLQCGRPAAAGPYRAAGGAGRASSCRAAPSAR